MKKIFKSLIKSLKTRWWLWLVVIIILFVVFGGNGKKPIVELDKVATKTITKTISTSGELKAPDSNNVYAPLTAQIDQVFVQEGQAVAAGQALYSYKEEALNSAVQAAELALLQTKQARETAKESVLNDIDITYYQAAVDQARAARDAAHFAYDQTNNETNKAAWNAAITAHELALKTYHAALEANPDALDLKSAEQAVTSAEAVLTAAQKNYDNKTVLTPISGVVSLARDASGQLVAVSQKVTTQGQHVVTVFNPSALRFEAEVDETDVANLVAGQEVDLEIDSYPGETFSGKIQYVSGTSTLNSTGSEIYIVVITIDKPLKTFRAGFSGQASFKIETVSDVLSIPSRAIIVEDDDDIVYVYRDGRAEKTVVELGIESATDAQVLSGVSLGDQVVVSNNVRDLEDSAEVEIEE